MSTSDASDKLSYLISSTGSTSLDIGDIERINDLDAGKLLLAWLAGQLDLSELSEKDSPHEEERNRRLVASMQDVILEKDEVLIANSLEAVCKSDGHPPTPLDYMPPSRSKRHTEYINSESDLVQREADLLRARISQTREASKKIAQSIKLLQRALFDLDSKARGSEERISELSINADTTVMSTLNSAQGLLQDLGFSGRKREVQDRSTISEEDEGKLGASPEENPDLVSARTLLLKSRNELSSITINLRQNLEDFSVLREQEAVRIQDIQAEVDRLRNAFPSAQESKDRSAKKSMKARRHSAPADRAMVTKELENICVVLEREIALRERGDASTSDALNKLLSELDEVHHRHSVEDGGVDVEEMLRHAWALDQDAILHLQEEVLDKALLYLDLALSPLDRLHCSLSCLARCVQDAEANLEALGEELGDIYLDNPTTTRSHVDHDDELEEQLKLVLIDLKDLRPSTAAPLMLLTRDDILAELNSLRARSAALEAAEKSWADDLIHKYSVTPIHPALTEIYMNSPLNTSPPFAFPADVRELEAQTRRRTAELQNLAISLEEEVRETFAKQSNLKRMSGFIDKWSGA